MLMFHCSYISSVCTCIRSDNRSCLTSSCCTRRSTHDDSSISLITPCFLLDLRLCFVASATATKVIKVDTADISAKRTSSSSVSDILPRLIYLGEVNYYVDIVDLQIHNKSKCCTANSQQIHNESTSPQQVHDKSKCCTTNSQQIHNKSTTSRTCCTTNSHQIE